MAYIFPPYMLLAQFLTNLFTTGEILLPCNLEDFSMAEEEEALAVLNIQHIQDKLHIPGQAPDFYPEAALWYGKFLFRSMQLLLLREMSEAEITKHLPDFAAEKTPEAVYSADLTLRHLPQLFDFAKGLAPEDLLVKKLQKVATDWPFSSVGIELSEEAELATFLSQPSLLIEYCDRIISSKDLKRAQHPEVTGFIAAALGAHAEQFWPEFALTNTTQTT